jgi:peroxiredoxin Q/BCP
VLLNLSNQVKDNGIVLFAYPKANTKGCTSQAVGLSEKVDELAAAGYKVYGISADKPKSQANWRKKENLKMNLLCDPSHEVGSQKTHGRQLWPDIKLEGTGQPTRIRIRWLS